MNICIRNKEQKKALENFKKKNGINCNTKAIEMLLENYNFEKSYNEKLLKHVEKLEKMLIKVKSFFLLNNEIENSNLLLHKIKKTRV